MKQLLCVVNLLKYEKHLKFLTDPLPPGKAGEPGLFTIRYKSSKLFSIAVATHLQREGVLTICKCGKYRKKRLLLKNPSCKICRKRSLNGLQNMPEGWEMDPALLAITFMRFGLLC